MPSDNKRDFDAVAKSWDEAPGRVQMGLAVAAAIRREVPLSADMDALDFGCGTGLVTLALARHLHSVLAVDASAGMLEVLQQKLAADDIESISTLQLDLTTGDLPEACFHLIFSSMALHHIADPAALLGKLCAALLPGGFLCIADLDAEDGSFHPDKTGVHHFGFGAAQMRELFEGCGLTGVRSSLAHTIERPAEGGEMREYRVLVTVGGRLLKPT